MMTEFNNILTEVRSEIEEVKLAQFKARVRTNQEQMKAAKKVVVALQDEQSQLKEDFENGRY